MAGTKACIKWRDSAIFLSRRTQVTEKNTVKIAIDGWGQRIRFALIRHRPELH
jgi:hypothetical protein